MTKTYPDRTFEEAARERGYQVQCMWQMKGPKMTSVAWIECLVVDGCAIIVETFEGGGWELFTTGRSIDRQTTIDNALDRIDWIKAA